MVQDHSHDSLIMAQSHVLHVLQLSDHQSDIKHPPPRYSSYQIMRERLLQVLTAALDPLSG